MPLMIDEGRIPTRWAEKRSWRAGLSIDRAIRVALINNMPDAALEDTELQFFELLDTAAEDTPYLSSSSPCRRFREATGENSIWIAFTSVLKIY